MRGNVEACRDRSMEEGIRSTPLAWWGAALVTGMVGVGGLVGGLLVAGLFWGVVLGVYLGGLRLWGASAAGMFHGLGCVLAVGTLGGAIVSGAACLDFWLNGGASQRVHNAIVHWQTRRCWQPSITAAEANLPEGALSRADPRRGPQPTPASLSLAGKEAAPIPREEEA